MEDEDPALVTVTLWLFQVYSMIDPPDLSPGSSPWDTNRTNRTQSSGGKYESASFWGPADIMNLTVASNLVKFWPTS